MEIWLLSKMKESEVRKVTFSAKLDEFCKELANGNQ